MIGTLISREIKKESIFKLKGYKKFLNILSNILIFSLVIILEVLVYDKIFDKVKVFDGFNESLFIILESTVTLIGIVSLIPVVLKSFFQDKREKIILGTSPLTSFDVVFSKSCAIFIKGLILNLTTFFVFGIVYGIKSEVDFIFYIMIFFSTILNSIFIVSIALILSMPTHLLSNLIKKYKVLSIIFTILASLIIVTLYGLVLNLFINLIRNSSLDKIFNTSNAALFNNIANGLYPIKSMIDYSLSLNMSENAFYTIAVIIPSFLISFFSFNIYLKKYYDSSLEFNSHIKNKNLNIVISSTNKALFKKEFGLALSNHDGIFSYLVLILMQPFLVYGVISSINLIFRTGNFTYVTTLFPAIFLTVDAILILLFLSVINMTSSLNLNKEKDTLMIMKTMPVSFKKQLLIKILVTFIISFASFFVTIFTLTLTNEISWIAFTFLLIIGSLNIFSLNILSVFNDLKLKSNSSTTSLVLGFIFPIIIVILGTASTFLVEEDFEELVFYGVIAVLELAVFAIFLTIFLSRVNKMFIVYEGVK